MNPLDAEYEAGQAATTFFQVFGMARPGTDPILPALVARAPATVFSLQRTM